jgi:outer membrane protein insertion porin family
VFSIQGEGGAIKSFENRNLDGVDDVRLTDRFYLGEPQIRGFDIRGVGPRVLRKPYIDSNGDGVIDGNNGDGFSDSRSDWADDALGGKYYYLGRAELEIPLGSGVRELGLRPSIFVDAGAVWGVTTPTLDRVATATLIPERNDAGQALYTQIDAVDANCVATSVSITPNATNPTPPACLGTNANSARGNTIAPFQEFFVGDTWKPRVAVGIGVNWNSPFGPFRINFSRVLVKQEGDDTKAFNFNVGTQF